MGLGLIRLLCSCFRPPFKHARVAQVAQVASGRIVSWFQQKGYG